MTREPWILLIFLHPKDRILVNNVATMSIAVKFISLISTMPPSPPSECVTWTRPHSTGPKTMEQLSTSASTLLALKNCFLIPGLRLMNYPSMFVVVTDYFVQVFLACEHVWFGKFWQLCFSRLFRRQHVLCHNVEKTAVCWWYENHTLREVRKGSCEFPFWQLSHTAHSVDRLFSIRRDCCWYEAEHLSQKMSMCLIDIHMCWSRNNVHLILFFHHCTV